MNALVYSIKNIDSCKVRISQQMLQYSYRLTSGAFYAFTDNRQRGDDRKWKESEKGNKTFCEAALPQACSHHHNQEPPSVHFWINVSICNVLTEMGSSLCFLQFLLILAGLSYIYKPVCSMPSWKPIIPAHRAVFYHFKSIDVLIYCSWIENIILVAQRWLHMMGQWWWHPARAALTRWVSVS